MKTFRKFDPDDLYVMFNLSSCFGDQNRQKFNRNKEKNYNICLKLKFINTVLLVRKVKDNSKIQQINFYFYFEMHRPQVTFISNHEATDQQPSKHKILKNSFKLTLKSAQKTKLPTSQSSRFVPQVSCRLNRSGVNNEKESSRQIIKKQIDSRLHKAYSSIVRHKSIQLTGKKSKKLELSSSPLSSLHSPEDQHNGLKINQVYKELPYELLRDYIQNIYEEYSIPDPLANTQIRSNNEISSMSQTVSFQKNIHLETPTKPDRILHEQNRISTKKKILLLKNHFIDQLNTEKKVPLKIDYQKKNLTETSQIISIQQNKPQAQKNSNLTTHKKKLSFALKQRPRVQEPPEKGLYNLLEETKFSASSVNNHLNFSLVHPTNDSYSHSRVENTRVISDFRHPQGKKTEQVFRYCFVCEEAILEANILYHQKACKGLQEILTKPKMQKAQFLSLMDLKISKIEKQVREILNEVKAKQTTDKLSLLKDKVLEWIGIIEKQSALNKSTQFKQTLTEQKNIDSIIESTKLIKTLQLINKLKWFVHLKMNFLRKTQSNPDLF